MVHLRGDPAYRRRTSELQEKLRLAHAQLADAREALGPPVNEPTPEQRRRQEEYLAQYVLAVGKAEDELALLEKSFMSPYTAYGVRVRVSRPVPATLNGR